MLGLTVGGSGLTEGAYMNLKDVEYEVAFSFHSKDEKLAQELNDLISTRFSTFIYSEQQKVLAGRDGEAAFNEVFGSKARVVVILHREEWGLTPFTRIEQTAIRNRAFNDGYDFTVFVPTDGKGVPSWVPKTQLYVGLDRWGVEGAAAVIEAAVQRQGGEARPETAVHQAARIQRQRQFQQEQRSFRDSPAGIMAARSAWIRLKEELPLKVNELSGQSLPLAARISREQAILVYGLGLWMVVEWRQMFSNTLDSALLSVEFWRGVPPQANAYSSYDGRQRIQTIEFDYQLFKSGSSGYTERRSTKREIESDGMVEHLLKLYLEENES